jgi:hypothetical protein
VPAAVTWSGSLGTASQIALYVDASSVKTNDTNTIKEGLEVLAPRGWSCQGVIGGDGSRYLSVYPAAEQPEFSRTGSLVPEGVSLDFPTAVGEIVGDACPYFQSLDQGSSASYCNATPAADQQVTHLSSTSVEYVDPTGSDSNSAYPTYGALAYVAKTAAASSNGAYLAQAECTLALVQHSSCTAILNLFLQEYGEPPR